MVLNYRHSEDAALSRARTFEFDLDIGGTPAVDLEPAALRQAARIAPIQSRRVHPRQIEHAIYVRQLREEVIEDAYGEAGAADSSAGRPVHDYCGRRHYPRGERMMVSDLASQRAICAARMRKRARGR